jgi:hypothetical protein
MYQVKPFVHNVAVNRVVIGRKRRYTIVIWPSPRGEHKHGLFGIQFAQILDKRVQSIAKSISRQLVGVVICSETHPQSVCNYDSGWVILPNRNDDMRGPQVAFEVPWCRVIVVSGVVVAGIFRPEVLI